MPRAASHHSSESRSEDSDCESSISVARSTTVLMQDGLPRTGRRGQKSGQRQPGNRRGRHTRLTAPGNPNPSRRSGGGLLLVGVLLLIAAAAYYLDDAPSSPSQQAPQRSWIQWMGLAPKSKTANEVELQGVVSTNDATRAPSSSSSAHKTSDDRPSISEMRSVGYTAADLRREGYSVNELLREGFAPEELVDPPPPPSPPPQASPAPPTSRLVDELNARYAAGMPSHDATAAGVLVHQVDALDDGREGIDGGSTPWLPCPPTHNGAPTWCRQFSDRFSASFISARLPFPFSRTRAGFVLSPSHVKIRCSYPTDGGSMKRLCDPPGGSDHCSPGCWVEHETEYKCQRAIAPCYTDLKARALPPHGYAPTLYAHHIHTATSALPHPRTTYTVCTLYIQRVHYICIHTPHTHVVLTPCRHTNPQDE